MTDEILLKIKDVDDDNTKLKKEEILYDDLTEKEKEEYNYIWETILNSFKEGIVCGSYSFVTKNCYSLHKYSNDYPYMSKNLEKILKQDGFDVITSFDDYHAYKRRFEINSNLLVVYAQQAKQKVLNKR